VQEVTAVVVVVNCTGVGVGRGICVIMGYGVGVGNVMASCSVGLVSLDVPKISVYADRELIGGVVAKYVSLEASFWAEFMLARIFPLNRIAHTPNRTREIETTIETRINFLWLIKSDTVSFFS
jgi:hypothetical protein